MSVVRPRARVIRAADARGAKVVPLALAPSQAQSRRMAREIVEAHDRARVVAEAAQAGARGILVQAQAAAAHAAAQAAREAQQAEQAKLASMYLALRAAEEARAERDMARTVAVAVALSERLIGAALEVHPDRIAHLARQALVATRAARRVRIEAHPLDVPSLEQNLAALGYPEGVVQALPSDDLARGDLRITTDIGALDARLTPQLERLAAALRDTRW